MNRRDGLYPAGARVAILSDWDGTEAIAELVDPEPSPGRQVAKVIYEESRTGAVVAWRRIVRSVDDHIETQLLARAAEIQQQIATCHERRSCPRCGAPLGERCHSLKRAATSTKTRPVKHPHRERYPEIPLR